MSLRTPHMQAVPFRNPHLDPMSPSGLASPPSGIVSPTIMPPSHMTMMMIGSPPQSRGGAGDTTGGVSDPAALTEALMGLSVSAADPAKLWQRRVAAASASAASSEGPNPFSQASSPSPSYLGCLLPPEARGLTVVTTTGKKLTANQSPEKGPEGSGTAASSPSQPIHFRSSPSGLTQGDLTSISGGQPVSPLETTVASTTPPKAAASASPPSEVGGSHGGHYGRIRKELGSGEGVTALLERSRKAGPVVASEDDAGHCLSDDETGRGGGLPMSPTTRLRRDTFGATLDFVEALCDASSSLATFSQVRFIP